MSRDYPFVLATAFVVVQTTDAITALVVSRELNPIIGATSPAVAIALKVILVCFVLVVVHVIRRQRPLLARVVFAVGIVAGVVGTISNTSLTPFHG